MLSRQTLHNVARKGPPIFLCVAGAVLLFWLYTWGISKNPLGFYLDESATAYDAYLVSRTGAGEFGPKFPILFQQYADGNPTYVNPLTIYLLAIVFRFLPPSIPVARTFAAFWMFAACLLLGVLAQRISRQRTVGIIVAATALLTPWFFEIGRLVFDAHLAAFTVVVFLLAAYRLQSRQTWDWGDIAIVAGSLAVVTYGYFSGRVLAPLFALGLLFFATTTHRFFGVVKVWLAWGLTLVPLILFNRSHPGVLTKRLPEVSYIKPGVPLKQIASEFVRRYVQDQSLTALLITGDYHPRNHVQGSGGAIFLATFVLAVIGLWLIFAHGHWRTPWWRFVIYAIVISIVPGAITNEPFHQVRLMAYPVFLFVLTIPALEFLLAPHAASRVKNAGDGFPSRPRRVFYETAGPAIAPDQPPRLSRPVRIGFLAILLVATVAQAIDFQIGFWRKGAERVNEFDTLYKPLYDQAVAQPERPIYLENGRWGPAYVDAYWYATVEGRSTSEFVRLPDGTRPPSGAIVLSSNSECQNCQPIQKSGAYLLYKAK